MVRKHLHWRSLVGWDVHTSSLQFSFWMLHPFLHDLLYCRHHWSVGWLSLSHFHHFQPYTYNAKNLNMKFPCSAYILKPLFYLIIHIGLFELFFWFDLFTALSITLQNFLATLGIERHYLAWLMHLMQAQTIFTLHTVNNIKPYSHFSSNS